MIQIYLSKCEIFSQYAENVNNCDNIFENISDRGNKFWNVVNRDNIFGNKFIFWEKFLILFSILF